MFLTLILFAVSVCVLIGLFSVCVYLLYENEYQTNPEMKANIIVISFFITFMCFLSTKTPIMAIITMAFIIVVMVTLAVTAHHDAREILQYIAIGVLELALFVLARFVSARITDYVFLHSFLTAAPLILFVAVAFFLAIDYLVYRHLETGIRPGDPRFIRAKKLKKAENAGIAAKVLIMVGACVIVWLIATQIAWASAIKGTSISPKKEWYTFYNTALQDDGDSDNDFNFGPDPSVSGKTPEYYDRDLKERIKNDPLLGSMILAWTDIKLGTHYIDVSDEGWASAINTANKVFMADQKSYNEVITSLFALLDTAEKSVEYTHKGLEDQAFMNPYTASGIPEICAKKTNQGGHFLVYKFRIKGEVIRVEYRIKCGYQPTNVGKYIPPTNDTPPVPPTPTPSIPTPPTPSVPTVPVPVPPAPPTPVPPAPPTPTPPSPTPPPVQPKDKTKGTRGDLVAPNDDPGPGESTNNGAGATHSTEENLSNSINLTIEEYKKQLESLKNANAPSPAPNQNDILYQPTPVTPPAETTDGNPINSTPPAGQWEGPAD